MKVGAPFPCSRIDEILYDYLGSDLETQEREAVERHLGSCPSCARALQETEQMLQGLAVLKPSPEFLDVLVQEFRQVRDSDQKVPFGSLRENGTEHPGFARMEEREVVEPRPAPEQEPGGRQSVQRPAARGSRRGARGGGAWPKLLAAALAAVTLALATWVLQLQGQVEELSLQAASPPEPPPFVERDPAVEALDRDTLARVEGQLVVAQSELIRSQEKLHELEEEITRLSLPQAFVPTAHMYPRTFLRGSGETPVVTVPQAAGFFQLTFVVGDLQGFSTHEIEVLTKDGALVWRSAEVKADVLGNFTSLFRRGFLAAGAYSAVVFGVRGGEVSELTAYDWELVYD